MPGKVVYKMLSDPLFRRQRYPLLSQRVINEIAFGALSYA